MTTPNLGTQCLQSQKLLGYDSNGSVICGNDLVGNSSGSSSTNQASNVIGSDGSIKQATSSTLADLNSMNNQTLFGNTKVDYLTIKGNYQLQNPPCGYTNIRMEPETNELQMTDCHGGFVVLSQQTPYYYSVGDDTSFNGIGFSPAFYQGTAIKPYGSLNEGNVRLPVYHGGEIQHAQCNTMNNSKNGVTIISLDENGGPVSSISIPAGGWGTTYYFNVNTNLNPGSQLTWKLDTSKSTSGVISFFCNANP